MKGAAGGLFRPLALATLLSSLFLGGISTVCTSGAATPAGPALCSLKNLSVYVASGSAAGGSEGMLIAFRNKGRRACLLQGHPRIVAKRPGVSTVAVPKENTYLGGWVEQGTQPPPVELAPHELASAIVASGDEPFKDSSCVHHRYRSVVVSLPGSTVSQQLTAALPREATTLPSCSAVQVTPFLRGLTWEAPT
jgi:hypothetical protein